MTRSRRGGSRFRRIAAIGLGGLLVAGLAAAPAWGAQPDPPQGQPDVTSGNTKITVDFTPSFYDGGFPIDSYTATCTPSPSGTPVTASGAGPPIAVTGVTNGTTYTCTVHAHNTNGETSVESAPSDPVTPAPQVPDTPAKPTASAGNQSAIVGYSAPADNGSAITSYTAACTSSDGGAFGSASGPGGATSITVTHLTTNKTYTCTVTATNGIGESNESPDSDPVIPAQVPDAPTITSVTRGNGAIDVSFSVPNANGSPITSFSATCTSSNGGATGTNTGMTTSITVSGLTNARTYRCTARATNTYGPGPPSAPSAAVVPATVPNPPKIGATDPGDGAAAVNFTPQADNGAAITSYTATCTSTDGGTTGTGSATKSPVPVGGLDNGHQYSCSVNAINAIGPSADSPGSPPFVVGEPVPPQILTIVPASTTSSTGTVSVALEPGADNGAPITRYLVTCRGVTTGGTRSASSGSSSVAVGGLDTGKVYLCSASATNERGTSRESTAVRAVAGTPGPPKITKVAQLSHGLAFAFLSPRANGRPITDYHVQCTSSNGGAGQSAHQTESPVLADNLSVGGSYTCTLLARNSRGDGTPVNIGPIVVKPPRGSQLASCTGNRGTMTIDPAMQQDKAAAHTLGLSATLAACSGPYVTSARVTFPLNTKRAASCASAVGLISGGYSTVFWTTPLGMGKSLGRINLKITATGKHVTKATFFGTITSGNGIFKGAHVNGALTLGRGFHTTSAGGDCSTQRPLGSLPVTAMTLVLS